MRAARHSQVEMPAPITAIPSFVTGDITINFENHEVTLRGQPVIMTPTEYNLLFLPARNAGRVVPFGTLLDRIWGWEDRDQHDYLKTYISDYRLYTA